MFRLSSSVICYHLKFMDRKVNLFKDLRIRMSLVLYQTWLKKDELDSLGNEV